MDASALTRDLGSLKALNVGPSQQRLLSLSFTFHWSVPSNQHTLPTQSPSLITNHTQTHKHSSYHIPPATYLSPHYLNSRLWMTDTRVCKCALFLRLFAVVDMLMRNGNCLSRVNDIPLHSMRPSPGFFSSGILWRIVYFLTTKEKLFTAFARWKRFDFARLWKSCLINDIFFMHVHPLKITFLLPFNHPKGFHVSHYYK